MSLFLSNLFLEIIIVVLVLFITVYWYFHNAFKYWELKGIPTSQYSFPFGHLKPFIFKTESLGHSFQRIYNEFVRTYQYVGWYSFSKPSIIVTDPEQIKNILVRDFNNFHDRGIYYNEKDDPLSAHLFSLEGRTWKNLRSKLTPTFTSGKLKFMYLTILERAEHLNLYLKDAVLKDSVIEMKDVLARYTTDVIGTCAFGFECNSINDPDTEFRRYGQKIFVKSFLQYCTFIISIGYKDLALKLGIGTTRPDVSKFFLNVIKDTVKFREENNIKKNDFMDLLIQLKNKGKLDDDILPTNNKASSSAITIEEAAAQAFVFFLAGFEASSTLMSFCLYELAVNHKIQEMVRQEIKTILDQHDGRMTYSALVSMPYLDRVIDETLRKYPTLPFLNRICTKDYQIPGTNTIINKGTKVFIPVRGLHFDPQHYPNPDEFDPDRFTEECKATRHHFTYLPFGEGPRICIGLRFGLMQSRLGLVSILKNFSINISDKTPVPLTLDHGRIFTTSLGGIWLKLSALDNSN